MRILGVLAGFVTLIGVAAPAQADPAGNRDPTRAS